MESVTPADTAGVCAALKSPPVSRADGPGRLILRAEYDVPIPSSPVKRIRGQVRAVRPYHGAALIIDRHTLEELGMTPIGKDALPHQV